MCDSECVPAVVSIGKKKGQYSRQGGKIARAELTKRDGPPPFLKAVCRHLCKNDSTAPNGFTCTRHTVWGTYQENQMDKSPENRKASASAGGKAGASAGAKAANAIERTCSHCGKTMKGRNYFRWHGDNCKSRAASFKDYIEGEEDDKH